LGAVGIPASHAHPVQLHVVAAVAAEVESGLGSDLDAVHPQLDPPVPDAGSVEEYLVFDGVPASALEGPGGGDVPPIESHGPAVEEQSHILHVGDAALVDASGAADGHDDVDVVHLGRLVEGGHPPYLHALAEIVTRGEIIIGAYVHDIGREQQRGA